MYNIKLTLFNKFYSGRMLVKNLLQILNDCAKMEYVVEIHTTGNVLYDGTIKCADKDIVQIAPNNSAYNEYVVVTKQITGIKITE